MTKPLTGSILRKLIKEEKARLAETLELGKQSASEAAKCTKEVKAEKFAGTISSCVDYYKACSLKEEKILAQLAKLQEAKKLLKRQILNNLK